MQKQKPFRLITIPVSHYCEKVRWTLDILKLPYVEEPHMPPFYRFATTKVGGESVPVLVTEDQVLTDSTDILKYLDSIAPDDAKLYPVDSQQLQEVEKLEELFDKKLAVAVRDWAYFYIVDNSQIIKSKWTHDVPFFEKLLFPVFYPIMRSGVKNKYHINEESAAQAYAQIESIFAKVNGLLADGRNYLVGDKISAADITFASLAAPILQPPQHPINSDSEELPAEMLSKMKKIQETAAGKFVLNLYKNWR
ncbi:glutathione S-transferase family protein [Rivularia sp. UHCC 0363]|uniref:glutathione S-transferase family protein n=1 Tax=Rivularia sp. UHCC 0363 TaxID=3110244 RepID=UPI002B1EE717|nr:glutathione S-transferase family protein [Rivularia sp. UHCC 0363]MEA5596426.1 glutathione S-transferase family protein [Rivularia sp. UHCC 0363]